MYVSTGRPLSPAALKLPPLDPHERAHLKKASPLGRLKNWKRINELDNDFFNSIISYFKQKYAIQNDRLFQKIWNQSLGVHDIRWEKSQPLTPQIFNAIDRAINNTLIYSGRGANRGFQPSRDQWYGIVHYLLGQGELSPWLDWKVIKALLFSKNPEFQKRFRVELQNALDELLRYPPALQEEVLYEAYVSNILALLPFGYPEVGETITIPQKQGDGKWEGIPYTIDKKFDLSPRWFSTPFPAFGLVSERGPPLLAFLGTTYPAGDGYVATLLSDCTPFTSVGHAAYLMGKQQITSWLEDKRDVLVYGTSLGGALALHALRYHEDKIAGVYACNPAGLYGHNWSKKYEGAGPKIKLYFNYNDPVVGLGTLPDGENVEVFRLVPGENGKGENFLKAHIRAYSGREYVTLLKTTPSYENGRPARYALTIAHQLFSSLFFIPILSIHLVQSLLSFLIRLISSAIISEKIVSSPPSQR